MQIKQFFLECPTLKRSTIRHPTLTSDNTIMVRCCANIRLLPSKTYEKHCLKIGEKRKTIGILLEIILNFSKCLTVSICNISLKYQYSVYFIRDPLWIFYVARCVYSTLKKKRYFFFLRGQMYTSGSTFMEKI